MNNRQARNFAIGSTVVASLAFLGLTLDSHRQFPKLTNADNITPAVTAGTDVWHKYNCINCHTLFGEGAYYAPDLTKITQHRGEAYLKAYMKDPSKFYDEQKHRRLMPTQNLSDQEISDLIAFLDWVSKVDNQGWPPRPIMVTGGITSAAVAASVDQPVLGTTPVDENDDDRAKGQNLFRTASPQCTACHSTEPGITMAGPSLAGIGARAENVISAPDYKGQAKDAASYIRESITHPSAYVVPGAMFSANGTSFMPEGYASSLTDEQLQQIAAYLLSLK
ncbi:MAG TPA: c-type cytochrome [Dongiaceae bacterium]|nr:c-type cytochrome [Dongiaceae bacterium]